MRDVPPAATALEEILGFGLLGRLRRDAHVEWATLGDHPFVQAAISNALPRERTRRFMVQDQLYALHKMRMFCLVAYKARDFEDRAVYLREASYILETRLPGLVHACRRWDIDVGHVTQADEGAGTIALTRFTLELVSTGDALDFEVSIAPCGFGYAEIRGRVRALEAAHWTNNANELWLVREWQPYVDKLAYEAARMERAVATCFTEARYPALLDSFKKAIRLETLFWDLA